MSGVQSGGVNFSGVVSLVSGARAAGGEQPGVRFHVGQQIDGVVLSVEDGVATIGFSGKTITASTVHGSLDVGEAVMLEITDVRGSTVLARRVHAEETALLHRLGVRVKSENIDLVRELLFRNMPIDKELVGALLKNEAHVRLLSGSGVSTEDLRTPLRDLVLRSFQSEASSAGDASVRGARTVASEGADGGVFREAGAKAAAPDLPAPESGAGADGGLRQVSDVSSRSSSGRSPEAALSGGSSSGSVGEESSVFAGGASRAEVPVSIREAAVTILRAAGGRSASAAGGVSPAFVDASAGAFPSEASSAGDASVRGVRTVASESAEGGVFREAGAKAAAPDLPAPESGAGADGGLRQVSDVSSRSSSGRPPESALSGGSSSGSVGEESSVFSGGASRAEMHASIGDAAVSAATRLLLSNFSARINVSLLQSGKPPTVENIAAAALGEADLADEIIGLAKAAAQPEQVREIAKALGGALHRDVLLEAVSKMADQRLAVIRDALKPEDHPSFFYMPLPIKIETEERRADVYYRRRRKENGISILVALQTHNLGEVRCLIHKFGEDYLLGFALETDAVAGIFREHLPLLRSEIHSLSGKGGIQLAVRTREEVDTEFFGNAAKRSDFDWRI